MIINEDANVKLTPEQLQAIEVATQRLYNLQNETNAALKVLSALKNDSIVALKDKNYQEEQLSKVTEQVRIIQSELENLSVQKYDLITDLSLARSELSEIKASSERKMAEITEQVKLHSEKENDFITREICLSGSEREYEEKSQFLQARINRINEAING